MLRLRLSFSLLLCAFALVAPTLGDAATRRQPDTDEGVLIARYARTFVGVRYRWGGMLPRDVRRRTPDSPRLAGKPSAPAGGTYCGYHLRRRRMTKKLVLLVFGVTAALATAVAGFSAIAGGPIMGPSARVLRPAFHGYYDGHKDTYLNTDVSSKADAAATHINYSAVIGSVKGLPEIYLVEGRAAHGQLAVF